MSTSEMEVQGQGNPRADATDLVMEDVLMLEVKQEKPPFNAKGASRAEAPPKEKPENNEVTETKIATLSIRTSKKRRRRSAAEIDRKYKCTFAGCFKAYGSEGSLIHHQKLKHPQQREKHIHASLWPPSTTSRNIKIRPATPLTMSFPANPKLILSHPSGKSGSTQLDMMAPPFSRACRRNMRSRSNSEPVTLQEEKAKKSMRSQSKSLRKLRQSAPPHAEKQAMKATTSTGCLDATFFPEPNEFEPLDKFETHPSCRRSESTASHHDVGLQGTSSGAAEPSDSLEWPASLASASRPSTSDHEAIDSDILSVLATCDVEDARLPSVDDFQVAPSSSSSYESTKLLSTGLECYKITENAPLLTQGAQELGGHKQEAELTSKPFETPGTDWMNALLLSDHLEKMTMVQTEPPCHPSVPPFDEDEVDQLLATSDPVETRAQLQPQLINISSLPLEVSRAKAPGHVTGDVGPPSGSMHEWFCSSVASERAKIDDRNLSPILRPSGENAFGNSNAQPSSEALDQLLQHCDMDEWKVGDVLKRDAEIGHRLRDRAASVNLVAEPDVVNFCTSRITCAGATVG
ncbi:hypothetical protein PsorP6_007116 [Peronosclerospora sorghi]|uniref:Uncharacterized protein n=1 Tax=Peronosclerospora sorghi TaxID=230839 RepID=A0ACC0W6J4_9STRA|nr:hypothetical protein PsorP6_007116 [Peronosclerospora sorghi]